MHGLLRARRVPRRAVLEVTDLPALRWRDEPGRTRWTPLTALGAGGGRGLRSVHQHVERCVRELRQVLRSG